MTIYRQVIRFSNMAAIIVAGLLGASAAQAQNHDWQVPLVTGLQETARSGRVGIDNGNVGAEFEGEIRKRVDHHLLLSRLQGSKSYALKLRAWRDIGANASVLMHSEIDHTRNLPNRNTLSNQSTSVLYQEYSAGMGFSQSLAIFVNYSDRGGWNSRDIEDSVRRISNGEMVQERRIGIAINWQPVATRNILVGLHRAELGNASEPAMRFSLSLDDRF